MSIKKINIGLILILVSSIIYGYALISASVYSHLLIGNQDLGWDRRYGVFGTALKEAGTIPIILSILLGLMGLMIGVKSIKTK
ncbi:phosphatase [Neobacillus notoginsengisoli]|uniref:Phosphatase n=1 Tax=Neobacillus notoginsengisoli TaxID=1578198 RepID=A0A417YS75_9BACI|nr:phosphatase [Neobacillus notoginsengisoli]RHW38142.1 phosphatase [Neobacillus notoginsengisoli]